MLSAGMTDLMYNLIILPFDNWFSVRSVCLSKNYNYAGK